MTSDLNSSETESSHEGGLPGIAGNALRWALWLTLVLGLTPACRESEPAGGLEQVSDCAGHSGPVVFIAVDALPSDLWQAPQWQEIAPALTQLAQEEGSWVGTGVSSSSAALPAAVSLWTGLEVRRHGVRGLLERDPETAGRSDGGSQAAAAMRERLDESVTNLAQVLAPCGYRATAEWGGSGSGNFALGLARGVEQVSREGRDHRRLLKAVERLEAQERELYWVHIDRAQPPWLAPATFLDRLGPVPAPAPVRWSEIEQLAAASPQRRLGIARAYYLSVAAADHRLGLVLERLVRSPGWENTILVVVATAAVDVEGERAAGYSNGLSPRELTVPLLVRLPERMRGAEPSDRRVGGAAGLLAYVAGLVGAESPPAVVPSILRSQGSAPPAIESELPVDRDVREVSLLEGDLQLVATQVKARRRIQLTESHLYRWSEHLEAEPVSDPGRLEWMSSRLIGRLRLESAAPRVSGEPCGEPAWDWSAERAKLCSSEQGSDQPP